MKDYMREIVDKFKEIHPLHHKYLKKHLESMDADFRNLANEYLENYLSVLKDLGITFTAAVEAYNNMIIMLLEEQMYFVEFGEYRYSTFKEANELVYNNPDFMRDYMIGVALSQFLWKNHSRIFRFFKDNISKVSGERYLEIGPGHGLFFMEAIRTNNFKHHCGVDVSKTSINFTDSLLSKCMVNSESYELILKDIMEFETDKKYDFISFGEVIEHLERPEEFLMKIRSLLSDNGKVYISTCANGPAIDHIYLFNSVEEIRALLHKCGFKIESEIAVSVDNIPEELWIEKKANITYATIVSR